MYQVLDAVLVRAATHPVDLEIPSWPDLSDTADLQHWRSWLQQVWSEQSVAEAITTASPVLVEQLRRAQASTSGDRRKLRRIVLAVARYLLRMTGRSTPFGQFAGVAAATTADAPAVRWGRQHRAVVRPGTAWLSDLTTDLEQCTPLLRRVAVMVNNTARIRDGRLVVPFQRPAGAGSERALVLDELSVALTAPLSATLGHARAPILGDDLIAKLAAEFPDTSMSTIEAMVGRLVRLRVLLTGLRPPMTVTDGLGHLHAVLDSAPHVPAGARVPAQRRDRTTSPAPTTVPVGDAETSARVPDAAAYDGRLLDEVAPNLHSDGSPPVTVDLRLDLDATLPSSVMDRAAAAAAALTRLTPYPAGLPAWQQYQQAFLERYGPGAIVPLLELVPPETGLGLPATYRGAHLRVTEPLAHDRDRRLLRLVHRAVAAGQPEVVLDDEMIDDLAGDSPAPAPPHVELFLRVHADSVDALRQDRYDLVVAGASRAAGATTGRFLPLLDPADQQRFRSAYGQVATLRRAAIPLQVSCPPVLADTEHLARTPQQLAAVVSVNEVPSENGDTIALDDLGVGADSDGMYLVWLSRNRLVEPTLFSAVELRNYSHPLARFLCEVTRARTAVYMQFSWGIADGLPSLPRLRYGRTVLAAARWNLTADELPPADTSDALWRERFADWRHQYRVPDLVYLVEADNLLPLDLTQPLPLVLLRTHLDRHQRARLDEAPPNSAYGWLDMHAHEIVVPLTSTQAAAPTPSVVGVRPVRRDDAHLPGTGTYLSAKLYTPAERHTDLLHQIPELTAGTDDMLDWWYVPYADPEPHLRLRIRLPPSPDASGRALQHLGSWAHRQRERGLLTHLQVDTYQPEEGRYGHGPAMHAAEQFFVADSTVTAAHRHATRATADADALTAASVIDLAAGCTGSRLAGMAWLIEHLPHQPVPASRDIHAAVARLAHPHDDMAAVQAACRRSPVIPHDDPGTAAAPSACLPIPPRRATGVQWAVLLCEADVGAGTGSTTNDDRWRTA